MGSPARVSVVVPTFDRRTLLAQTLDSLAALDPPPTEVIVVSDGSSDGTEEMVADRGVTLLRSPRLGAAGARNTGWRHAQGDVIAFTDDDCVVDSSWVGALSRPFSERAVGLVQGRTLPAGPAGRFDRTIDVRSEYGLYESCNIAYRRSALEQVNGFDEDFVRRIQPRVGLPGRKGGRPFAEDTHLAWRVRRAGWQTVFEADAVARHAVFPGTLTESLREEWRKGNFTLVLDEIPELRDLLPGGGYCLRRQSLIAQAALVGLALALAKRPRGGLALALPYALWLSRRGTPAAIAHQLARDTTCSISLLVGSAKTGRLLL